MVGQMSVSAVRRPHSNQNDIRAQRLLRYFNDESKRFDVTSQLHAIVTASKSSGWPKSINCFENFKRSNIKSARNEPKDHNVLKIIMRLFDSYKTIT